MINSKIDESVDIKSWCVPIQQAKTIYPELSEYLNEDNKLDFGDSESLSHYNKAVIKVLSGFSVNIQQSHLIPAACLRFAYVKVIAESFLEPSSSVLDIGAGASGIISLFAVHFGLKVTATEINLSSISNLKLNIEDNNLQDKIRVIQSFGGILTDVIPKHSHFDALFTYPPTYSTSPQDLGKLKKKRGFKGVHSEMIGGGSTGFYFISQLIHEACSHEFNITHITVLCLFHSHVDPTVKLLSKFNRKIKVIELITGTRKRYLVVGTK